MKGSTIMSSHNLMRIQVNENIRENDNNKITNVSKSISAIVMSEAHMRK